MYGINEEDFLKAIDAGDLVRIRTGIRSCLMNNLSQRGNGIEAHKVMELARTKLAEKQIKLFVPYECDDGEVVFKNGSELKWTEEMYISKCAKLYDNFSVERYNEVLALGKYLYKNGNFTQPQEEEKPMELLSPQTCRRKIPLYAKMIAGAVLLAAVALVVILAFKK